MASDSTLSESTSAADLSAEIGSAVGADAVFDTVIEQESELSVEYDELTVDVDSVLAAVETEACADTTSTSCVAAFTAQRRRALAQTAAITITRTLAASERVKSVPTVSAASLAARLGVDASAIGSLVQPAIRSVRIAVVLNTVEDQDETQLIEASAVIFGVDSSTLTVTAISQFPPSPPPAPPPGAPPDYMCTNTCFFADDGVCNDGGTGSSDTTCSYSTDCSDCGARPPLDASPSPPPVALIESGESQALSAGAGGSTTAWLLGIGGAAVALLLCCVCIFFYRRRRRSKPVQPSYLAPAPALKQAVAPRSTAGASGSADEESRLSDASRLALQRAKRWQPAAGEEPRVARSRPAIRRARTNPAPSPSAPAKPPLSLSPTGETPILLASMSPTTLALSPFPQEAQLGLEDRPLVDPVLMNSMAAAARARAAMGSAPRRAPRMDGPPQAPMAPVSGAGRAAADRHGVGAGSTAPNAPGPGAAASSAPYSPLSRQQLPPAQWRSAPMPPTQHRSAPMPPARTSLSIPMRISDAVATAASAAPSGESPPPSPPMGRSRRSPACLEVLDALGGELEL